MQIADMRYLVTPYCPNVPVYVFEQAFLECARDYFHNTHAYESTQTMNTVIGQFEYSVQSSVDETSIIQVNDIRNEGGDSVQFVSIGQAKFKLIEQPLEIKPLTLSVILRPTISASEMNDGEFEENEYALRVGTVAKLKQQIGSDWYDPKGAVNFERKYQLAIGAKKNEIANRYNHQIFELAGPII
ncbi:hypothetical protein [Gayadomonas joobiniege]|uniref:hypothetical protein n=1 Tax=Gayadomonas joobiniege TaxID=1234606 RepID=UPI00036DC1F1|nr:hypothetical protein [Gayadomonas joobiniege]